MKLSSAIYLIMDLCRKLRCDRNQGDERTHVKINLQELSFFGDLDSVNRIKLR